MSHRHDMNARFTQTPQSMPTAIQQWIANIQHIPDTAQTKQTGPPPELVAPPWALVSTASLLDQLVGHWSVFSGEEALLEQGVVIMHTRAAPKSFLELCAGITPNTLPTGKRIATAT